MNPIDKEHTLKRYKERFGSYGHSPEALGWGKDSKQEFRFEAIWEIGVKKEHSVLDIGCGFGDLKQFMESKGWNGVYRGTELVQEFIDAAKAKDPTINIDTLDILAQTPEKSFDFAVSSGIFNHPMKGEDNYDYIEKMLTAMMDISNIGVSADFISTFVDYKEDNLFYSDPSKILQIAKKLSKRVILRHDYLPFEYCIYIFKDDVLESNRNIFKVLTK